MSVLSHTPGIKPAPWNFDVGCIADEWKWFWGGKSVAVIPGFSNEHTVGAFKETVIKGGAQAAEMVPANVGPLGLGYDRTQTGGSAYLRVAASGPTESLYTFRGNKAWTVCAVFQLHNTAADDRSIISRFGDPSTSQRQFLLRTDLQAAPSNLEVYQDNGATSLRITGGDVLELDTPYLVIVMCDGAQNGILYTFDLSTGKVLDNGLTGSFPNNVAPGTPEYIAMFGRTTGDPWSGTGWMASFHDFSFTVQQMCSLVSDVFAPIRQVEPVVGRAGVAVSPPQPRRFDYQHILAA